jgi:hypothetical protein
VWPERVQLYCKSKLVCEGLGLGREAIQQPIPHDIRKGEFCTAEAGGKSCGADNGGALLFKPAAQIGERRTVCDNIIDDKDAASRLDLPMNI